MSHIRLRRPSPALILSAAAFFMALGGVAYAVPGISSTTVSRPTVVRTSFSVGADSRAAAYASCPTGSYATGGGVGYGNANVYVQESGPVNKTGSFVQTTTGTHPTEWYAAVFNKGRVTSSGLTEYVWVICQHYS